MSLDKDGLCLEPYREMPRTVRGRPKERDLGREAASGVPQNETALCDSLSGLQSPIWSPVCHPRHDRWHPGDLPGRESYGFRGASPLVETKVLGVIWSYFRCRLNHPPSPSSRAPGPPGRPRGAAEAMPWPPQPRSAPTRRSKTRSRRSRTCRNRLPTTRRPVSSDSREMGCPAPCTAA